VAESLRDRLTAWLVPRLGYLYIRLLRATMRIEYRGAESLERARERSEHYILAFWHSRWVMMPYVYPGSRIVVLISRHRDAQMLGRILERFGLGVVFGSSTRGGVAGMRAMLRAVRDGHDVGIAPDGPKGPRWRVKPGVIVTAKLGGLPIVPVTFSSARARRLRSWDRTLIPRPFDRGLFLYGEPVWIPRDLDEDGIEEHRARLEGVLRRLTDEADRETGVGEEPRPGPDDAGGADEEPV
jgi:lysophospholipid acyltransferase (LPLAT)-like uncharacterized protein